MGKAADDSYRDVYSDNGFWAKVRRFGGRAGQELVEKAVLLYLVMRDPATPPWAKTTVIAALGYFIAPIDAIPDLLPGVGFTDDLSVLVLALSTVSACVTDAMKAKAHRAVERVFGGVRADGRVIETDATLIKTEPGDQASA